jgi:signal transduction histidine kinase
VQESVTNAMRHAPAASRIRIRLDIDASRVRAEVRNDGVRPVAADHRAGFGLPGLRERVEVLGGRLDAGSPDGREWVVDAEIPHGADGVSSTEGHP